VCVVAALAGGSDGRVVVPLRLDASSLTEPTDARLLRTTDEAVRGIAAIMAKKFGLPVPARVVVHVYDGRRAFEQGLIRDARVSPVQAATLSGFAIGVGTRGQVLLNERGDRTEREWLRLIAHELTHVSQIELAGGEERGEQWLAEGMAEYVAFSTLERLQLDTLERRRQAATAALRLHATLLQGGLDLEDHGTPKGFTAWHLRDGALPVYQLAFLLADDLIERRGFDRTRVYFASFRRSAERRANFAAAFGQSLEEFAADALARLKKASAL